MKPALLLVASIAILAACSTSTTNAGVADPAPQTMSDTEFSELWDNAYNANPKAKSEVYFAELLARNDLTDKQRGRAYYGRGTIRGIWVRDWPEAYPQCALGDLLKAVEYPMSNAQVVQTHQSIRYQYDRRKYFTDAPEACEANVALAKAWLSKPAF